MIVDIVVEPVPPTIVSVTPADGATEQPVGTTVAVRFSEPLDATSVYGSTLELELAWPNGTGTGAYVTGTVSLSGDGLQVLFEPTRPLPPNRLYRATFHGGVRDAGGNFYDGPVPVVWNFTTSAVVVPGGQVDPEQVPYPVAGRRRGRDLRRRRGPAPGAAGSAAVVGLALRPGRRARRGRRHRARHLPGRHLRRFQRHGGASAGVPGDHCQ